MQLKIVSHFLNIAKTHIIPLPIMPHLLLRIGVIFNFCKNELLIYFYQKFLFLKDHFCSFCAFFFLCICTFPPVTQTCVKGLQGVEQNIFVVPDDENITRKTRRILLWHSTYYLKYILFLMLNTLHYWCFVERYYGVNNTQPPGIVMTMILIYRKLILANRAIVKTNE